MDEKVKSFVENFNLRMSWNRDILNKFVDGYHADSEYISNLMRENLYTEDITEEGFDLETAKVWEYEDAEHNNVLEMEAFNNETYDSTYFWLRPDEDEEKYKSNRIKQIIKKCDNEIIVKTMEIHDLTSELNSIINFKKLFIKED